MWHIEEPGQQEDSGRDPSVAGIREPTGEMMK